MSKFLVILTLFICSCSPNWSYKNPEKWGNINEKYKFCKIGYNQSPIDVVGEFGKSNLSFNYQESEVDSERVDYELKVNFYGRSFLSRGGRKYFLNSLSFRHPSEHLVAGKTYSLEMQISHKSEDEQWLILSVFLEVGNKNPSFSELIKYLNSKEKEGEITPENLVQFDDQAFFYDGSFTTPPCKEGVKWYVMKTPIQISKDQMNHIIKSTIFAKMNARPLQEFHPEKY